MAIATGITIEEFEKLPDTLAHNHELVDGELVDVSGNTGYHNELRDFLIELLRPHVRKRKLGKIISEQEFDFAGNAHGPDVAFISSAKVRLYNRKLRIQRFVPDLAIEIVSQNDKFESLMKKAARYRKCGTKEVWVLSPETRKAFVQSEGRPVVLEDDQMFQSKLLPGFSIRLAELFDNA
jgi:Uma2 family endonuclease